MQESAPFKYTFTKKIGTEGLVLPSEEITLAYAPKSVASGQRIISKLEFYFRKGRCKWTVVDAIIYTSDMDILIQETQENTDLIEQNAQTIHNLIGGFVLYFQDDASGDIGGYKQLTREAPADALATSVTAITGADQEIEQWATESGVPALNLLLSGILEVHYHAWVSAGTKDIRIYFKLYKRTDPGGVETELLTTEESEFLPGVTEDGDVHALVPETELDTTDRLVLKLFASSYSRGSNPTLSFSIEGDTYTRVEIPAPIGSIGGDGFVHVPPTLIFGDGGFIQAAQQWRIAHSDASANISAGLLCPSTETDWKILIVHASDTASRTDVGTVKVGAGTDTESWSDSNVFNGVAMNLANAANATFYFTFTAAFSASEDDYIRVKWTKTANNGTGNLNIFGIFLVR